VSMPQDITPPPRCGFVATFPGLHALDRRLAVIRTFTIVVCPAD
jgi:hypothetical protein